MIAMSEETAEVRCPRCNCQDLRYSYYRIVLGRKRETRFCRNCGRRVYIYIDIRKQAIDGEKFGKTNNSLVNSPKNDL